jgi:hypothetical protein
LHQWEEAAPWIFQEEFCCSVDEYGLIHLAGSLHKKNLKLWARLLVETIAYDYCSV